MGRDKALLEIDGRSLVETAVRVLDHVASEVWLACGSEARYPSLGRRLVLDRKPGAGPLAGLAAALDELPDGWLCVLACDMPRVTPELFVRLLERAERDGLDACLALTERGWEPLCAVYHARCASTVRAALARGERRLVGFWTDGGDLRVGALQVAAGATAERDGDPCVNLNTPAEYERELAARGETRLDSPGCEGHPRRRSSSETSSEVDSSSLLAADLLARARSDAEFHHGLLAGRAAGGPPGSESEGRP